MGNYDLRLRYDNNIKKNAIAKCSSCGDNFEYLTNNQNDYCPKCESDSYDMEMNSPTDEEIEAYENGELDD